MEIAINFKNLRLAVIGLGYVGLPLATEFAKSRAVVGFDINKDRINELKEGFDSNIPKFDKIMEKNFTTPTKKNPLMNVLLPEIHEKPNRNEAAPSYNTNIRKEINEKSKSNLENEKLYKNLGDNLNHQHMMRNFHSMPNTSIPNNQKDFAMFCYGSMKSCKEGNEGACSKNLRRLGNSMY